MIQSMILPVIESHSSTLAKTPTHLQRQSSPWATVTPLRPTRKPSSAFASALVGEQGVSSVVTRDNNR